MRFDSRTAFVTGAGNGIRHAIPIRLVSEDAKIVVTDLNVAWAESTAAEIKQIHGSAEAFKLEVTRIRDVDKVMEHPAICKTHLVCWRGFS